MRLPRIFERGAQHTRTAASKSASSSTISGSLPPVQAARDQAFGGTLATLRPVVVPVTEIMST